MAYAAFRMYSGKALFNDSRGERIAKEGLLKDGFRISLSLKEITGKV